jgi:hypothetical protein
LDQEAGVREVVPDFRFGDGTLFVLGVVSGASHPIEVFEVALGDGGQLPLGVDDHGGAGSGSARDS